jgi:hypothetical protein
MAEESGRDVEIAPVMLVFQRESVVAENEQAPLPPAAFRDHSESAKTSSHPKSAVLQKPQHDSACRCSKSYDFTSPLDRQHLWGRSFPINRDVVREIATAR